MTLLVLESLENIGHAVASELNLPFQKWTDPDAEGNDSRTEYDDPPADCGDPNESNGLTDQLGLAFESFPQWRVGIDQAIGAIHTRGNIVADTFDFSRAKLQALQDLLLLGQELLLSGP